MKRDINWSEVNREMDQQFREDCQEYGWLNILEQLTSLKKAISSFKPGQGSKYGDFCPKHVGNAGDKYHLLPSAEDDGAGFCFKCKERYDGFETIMLDSRVDFRQAVQEVKEIIYPGGKQPYPWQRAGHDDYDSYIEANGGKPEVLKPRPKRSYSEELTPSEIKKAERMRAANNKLLDETVSINHDLAAPLRNYFLSRAIDTWGDFGDSLRFHPSVKFTEKVINPKELEGERAAAMEAKLAFLRNHRFYRSEQMDRDGNIFCDMGEHPAAIFIMRDNNTLKATSLQRVFLSPEGKKMELDGHHKITVKKRTARIPGVSSTGSSVHIDSPAMKIIGVAEGPETTLAVRAAIGMPMNCAIDAGGLGNWVPNATTDRVVIFTDKDRSLAGLEAAKKLQERLREEYIEAMIVEPPLDLPNGAKSIDWQDAVEQLGISAFPEWLVNWEELDV